MDNIGLTEEEQALLDNALTEAHEDKVQEDNMDILPPNSKTLLIDDTVSRFSSAVWFNKIQEQTVTLAGLGGIGSFVSLLLGRLKVQRLFLYDDDIVDATNMSGQFYKTSQIGSYKTSATYINLRNFAEYYNVVSSIDKFTSRSSATDIMICGFDNMEARRTFFNVWKKHVMEKPVNERLNCLFIDGRLAVEEFQIFCMTGADNFLMQKYESDWLFSDSEAEETICSYKQTSFCANMIASVMVNLFVNHIANMCEPLIKRELPFFTSYDAERMYFKTE